MSVDLDAITTLTAQLASAQAAAAQATDPTVRALLQAQVSQLSAQLVTVSQHAQARADSSSDMLNNLGLFSTLQSAVGGLAPTIIGLFKR